ncbi:MAG: MFS transporter [Gammaproteobacteria bacterium]|nr:MFS transporter [Gammaproteobacteria bacterium]
MTAAEDRADDQLPYRTKLVFGIGSAAESICLYSYGALVTIYYNQVLGMEIWMAGIAPTIAIRVDAFCDPFMGSFSDRFRSNKWGRRHPFMLFSPLPIALAFWCIFNPLDGLSEYQLFGWLTFWAIVLRTLMTIYHVPHLAMGGELAKSYTGRSAVMSYNNFFYWIGGAAMFKVNQLIFFATAGVAGNALLNESGYTPFSTAMALTIVVVLFSSAWFTRDRIVHMPQPDPDAPPFSMRDFLGDLIKAFSNRNYLFLMIAFFCLSMMLGVRGGIGVYMEIYYWELSAGELADVRFYPSLIGYVLGFALAAQFHRWFEKRATIVVTAVALSIFPALPVVLRLMGVFSENGEAGVYWGLMICYAFGALSGSVLNISVMSGLADIADQIELRHRIRQEGTLYAARTFFAKLDSSIGQALATFSLWLISFPQDAKPGRVPEDTIWWMGVIDSPITIIPGLIAACFYAQFRISRKSYEETRAALEKRRGEDEAAQGAGA